MRGRRTRSIVRSMGGCYRLTQGRSAVGPRKGGYPRSVCCSQSQYVVLSLSVLFSVSVYCPQSQCIVFILSLSVMSSVSVYCSQCHVLSLSVMSSVSVCCPQWHVLSVSVLFSVSCPQSQCFVLSLTCIIEICPRSVYCP